MHIGITAGYNIPLNSWGLEVGFFQEHMTEVTLPIPIRAPLT